MPTAPHIQVLPDAATLARIAGDIVVRYAQDAIVTRRRAAIALSGGQTPQQFHRLLSRPPHSTRLDFSAIDFFLVDERCVPPDDPRSNARAIREQLWDPARVPQSNRFTVRTDLCQADAAADYERRLRV